MARHFHDEALRRADLTCDYLKEARMDWSPRQLLGAEGAIREAVLGAFKEDLAAAAALTAQMGTITQKRAQGGRWSGVAAAFDRETNRASESAVQIVESAISGIMQAARTQIEAKEPADRPNFMQIFNAPVGAVAQGEASIGSVTQTNSSDIREQLRELANLIGDARQELGAEGSAQTAAALGAVQAEAEAENPSVGMVKAAPSEPEAVPPAAPCSPTPAYMAGFDPHRHHDLSLQAPAAEAEGGPRSSYPRSSPRGKAAPRLWPEKRRLRLERRRPA